ncbi:MAG: amidohydrolase family protein [Proteobacteria bacterium]|nr:amidohydrolase family protein [Pseudomonadota bacterium]
MNARSTSTVSWAPRIGTYAGDRPLDDPSLDPIYDIMERRNLIVFMHPTSTDKLERWRDYTLNTVLAWPNETTLAITRMIYAGVFDRHPKLQLALAHGGGNLVFMRGRIDLGYTAPEFERNPDCHKNISRPPNSYYRQLFFDTAVGAPEMLEFLIKTVGADRVVYGSDEPFEIADPHGDMALSTVRKLAESDANAILGGNLAAILENQH